MDRLGRRVFLDLKDRRAQPVTRELMAPLETQVFRVQQDFRETLDSEVRPETLVVLEALVYQVRPVPKVGRVFPVRPELQDR